MLEDDTRLDMIFSALHKGKLADEIDHMLEKAETVPRLRSIRRKIKPANPATIRVVSVLRQMDEVLYIRRAENSPEAFGDRFFIGVKIPGQHKSTQVTAEIRLHADALRKARRKISQKMHLHREAVEHYLVKQKTVLLHTKLPDEAIISQFGQQMNRIWKAQNFGGL